MIDSASEMDPHEELERWNKQEIDLPHIRVLWREFISSSIKKTSHIVTEFEAMISPY